MMTGTASVMLATAGFTLQRVGTREDDLALDSSTFVLLKHGRPIGSTRASVRRPQRQAVLPASATFAREIESAIAADAVVVEASLSVTDPHAGDRCSLALHLLKAQMVVCKATDADWLVAAVRDDELGFYRRVLNMEILSGVESNPGMATPQVLMGLQYREHAALLSRRIPLLEVTPADEAEYAATGRIVFAKAALTQHAA
jgi:hypothetical protein